MAAVARSMSSRILATLSEVELPTVPWLVSLWTLEELRGTKFPMILLWTSWA